MKQVRLALSGSGYRLPAHLGALYAVDEAGLSVPEISSTSGGSIIAALFASGISLADLRELCMTLDWAPYMTFSPWTFITKGALCTGDRLLDFLMLKTQGKTFADIDIDLKIVASDWLTEKEFVFSKATTPTAPIALAARASASIPLVFVPVDYAGISAVDGGCCENLPAGVLTVDDIPRIGISLQSDDAPLKPGKYGFRTFLPRLIDLLLASNETSQLALYLKNNTTIVRVPTGNASSFDRNMDTATRQMLFDAGHAATKAALSALNPASL
jgi:NTE family protein